jgi:hypothetical protein
LVGRPSRRGCRGHQSLRQAQAAHQLTLMDNLHQCFVLTDPDPGGPKTFGSSGSGPATMYLPVFSESDALDPDSGI